MLDHATYNVRRPLKDLSSEEFVLGVQSDKEISMTGSTPKTNSTELRSLSGRLNLYFRVFESLQEFGELPLIYTASSSTAS